MFISCLLIIAWISAMCMAVASLSIMKWEFNLEDIIKLATYKVGNRELHEILYWIERKSTILNIMEYSSHYLAVASKEIYCKTNRRKIGNLASQLV